MNDKKPPSLRLVPKPLGFDLRDRRSDKSGRGVDWTPHDALFDVSEATKNVQCTAIFISWMEQDGKGGCVVHNRFAGQPNDGPALILSAMGKQMHWDKK